MATARSSSDTTGDQEKPDLAAELAAVKAELRVLAKMVSRLAAAGLSEAGAGARPSATRISEDLVDSLKAEWAWAERRLAEETHAKPFRTLGLAALAGFIAALILRR